MRIHIVEEDPSLLNLLSLYLKQKGHDVYGHLIQHQCPSRSGSAQSCIENSACAEAVILNVRYPNKPSIDGLVAQTQKGCKIVKKNMAIMSPIMTEEQAMTLEKNGYSVLTKPFRLSAIDKWLNSCALRLQNRPVETCPKDV
ncbi:MAG: hypothetical protein JRE16_04965 [Deltaproteobacteria bacterium]|jgi:DNA-binding response OmpR family regulator|nr:hypothetical protein [Deltaproteobacteria bacterium]MBW2477442.1 hypothetical protein [Deltaproteobacteria bacterium]MBW2503904.1 hypothetical protein [Deltaproteobacteria bacterium]